jgi:hypothetical protein
MMEDQVVHWMVADNPAKERLLRGILASHLWLEVLASISGQRVIHGLGFPINMMQAAV